MMDNVCCKCKYGYDIKPGGQRPAQGTVWCGQRQMQMAKNRQMPCHVPLAGKKVRHCIDCKKAKMLKPSGETPQLGAAALQEIVKKIADKNGIAVRSFRILEPKEASPYRKVSIQIEFNPVNNILSLGQLFHDLEHHEKKLLISEMDLLIFNIRLPNNIQGNLVITGLMKGTKAKEKGKEG